MASSILSRSSAARPAAFAVAFAFALGLTLTASPALADSAEVRARARFAAGQRAYDLGKFDDALQAYSEAYAAKPLPALLFNIAQCHRQLGHYEQAGFLYQRYLELSPKAPNAAIVRDLIAEVNAKAAAQKQQAEQDRAIEHERELQQAREAAARAEGEAAAKKAEASRAELAREQLAPRPAAGSNGVPAQALPSAEVANAPAKHEKSWASNPWIWIGAGVVVAGAAVGTYALTAPHPRDATLGILDAR